MLIGDELLREIFNKMVVNVFIFFVLFVCVNDDIYVLEFFYGLIFVFKDFGGCFMV